MSNHVLKKDWVKQIAALELRIIALDFKKTCWFVLETCRDILIENYLQRGKVYRALEQTHQINEKINKH